MKRFHVHVAVTDLEQSIQFYAALFAAPPTIRKPDYAKWLLEDPRVNFAISAGAGVAGISHLGIQAENADELSEIHGRLEGAGAAIREEGLTTCCYANSEKSWVADPQGIAWETFLTLGESTIKGGCGTAGSDHGAHRAETPAKRAGSCCVPAA